MVDVLRSSTPVAHLYSRLSSVLTGTEMKGLRVSLPLTRGIRQLNAATSN